MRRIDADNWAAISPYLDQALDLSEDELARWLVAVEKENPALARDLQSLIDDHRAADRSKFLEGTAPPHPLPAAGTKVGAYTLVAPIGHGGMGTVWLARRSDGRFRRPCRGEAAERRARRKRRGGAVPPRGSDSRPGHAPPHRALDRRRRFAGRAALPRPRVRRGAADRCVLCRTRARGGRAHRFVPAGSRCRGARAREPRDSPRPEAVERSGARRWPREAARLRDRDARRVRGRDGDAADA